MICQPSPSSDGRIAVTVCYPEPSLIDQVNDWVALCAYALIIVMIASLFAVGVRQFLLTRKGPPRHGSNWRE